MSKKLEELDKKLAELEEKIKTTSKEARANHDKKISELEKEKESFENKYNISFKAINNEMYDAGEELRKEMNQARNDHYKLQEIIRERDNMQAKIYKGMAIIDKPGCYQYSLDQANGYIKNKYGEDLA